MNQRVLPNVLLVCISALFSGSSNAHHSLAQFDTTAPLWVKGTVVRFERVNPHSVIFMDEKTADGQVRRWAVDGPSAAQLERMSLDPTFLKPGDVIEVCGFATRDGAAAQRTLPKADGASAAPSAPSLKGQILNGTVLVMADGKKRLWSDYGQLSKCVSPEERDSLIR
jgi:hypothetical protein